MIGPNASLTPRGAWLFMGLMSAGAGAVCGVCVAMGFWPVVPFAGLELAALGGALWITQKRNRYREVVSVDADQVVVETGLLGQGAQSRVDFPRLWTRAELERPRRRNQPTRLRLSSSGRRVEIGRCLTDEERERLCLRVQGLLREGPQAVAAPPEVGIRPAGSFLGDW